MGYDNGTTLGIIILIVNLVVWGVAGIVAIALYVISSYFLMQLFRARGIEGWAAWVPVYAWWRLLELNGIAGWMSLFAIVPGVNIVTSVFLIIAYWRLKESHHGETGMFVLGLFFPFAFYAHLAKRQYDPGMFPARGWHGPFIGQWARQRPVGFTAI